MEGGSDAGQKRACQEIKERIAVLQRGVGGITKGQAVTYTLSEPSTGDPVLAADFCSGFRPTGVLEGATGLPVGLHGTKIQKVTDVVTGTGSVVRAVSFQHR